MKPMRTLAEGASTALAVSALVVLSARAVGTRAIHSTCSDTDTWVGSALSNEKEEASNSPTETAVLSAMNSQSNRQSYPRHPSTGVLVCAASARGEQRAARTGVLRSDSRAEVPRLQTAFLKVRTRRRPIVIIRSISIRHRKGHQGFL